METIKRSSEIISGFQTTFCIIHKSSHHQYFYDKLGNLIREYRHDSLDGTARSHVWHHRYDALGNRTETIRPDGQRIGYLHYGSGHLHGITLNHNEIAAFERDKLHRETERSLGKHIRQETQYDPVGRILQQIHNRSRREYGYDAAGQLTHIQSKGSQTQYRYDPIGRLIAAVTPDFSETFAFDPAGNRLNLSGNKQDQAGQTNSQEKPSLNKVWGNLLKEYSGVHYDYDQRGNLIRKTRNGETTDYHWNGYNQLVKIENRNGSTEYRYDPLGRRTAKIRNGETTVYHWQEDTLAIESTNGQNTHYLFEPGTFEPLAQFQTTSPIGIEREDKPAEPYSYDPETDPLLKIPPEPQEQSEVQPDLVYYQLDHLGTPIAAHNAKGEAVWTAEYEAWGRIRNETVSDGLKADMPFRFQGQYYDEESGLHYNRFRYYDPEIGRFVSQDPIGLLGGMNLFEYAPNPIIWVDSLGLHKKKRCCNGDPCSGKNPSATARRWQGSDPYPGIDSYKNVVVKAGTVLYTLYPHGNTPGNYFVTAKDVLAARTAREYNDSVQVSHKENTDGGKNMRTALHGFIVTKDTCMAKGITRANPHLGKGGATQYFIENMDKINLKSTNKLIKYGK